MRLISLGLGLAIGFVAASSVLAADAPMTLQVTPPPVAEEGWHPYVKAYGGATLANTIAYEGVDFDHDAGWLLGGAVGVQILDYVAVELDATYSIANFSAFDETTAGATFMGNVVITGALTDQIAVYGGLGLGAVGAQYDPAGEDPTDWGFGAGGQIFAGVSFAVTENISIFGEARYQAAFDTLVADHGAHDHEIDYSRTSVLAGVKLGM